MAYFNNLIVGGTAKFLQDVKIAGLESTPEELNYLHSETLTEQKYYLTDECDYTVGVEFCVSTSNKIGLIVGETYSIYLTSTEGETITSSAVAVDASADTGISGSVSLNFDDYEIFDGAYIVSYIDGTSTWAAGGSAWTSPYSWGIAEGYITGQGLSSTTKTTKSFLNDEIYPPIHQSFSFKYVKGTSTYDVAKPEGYNRLEVKITERDTVGETASGTLLLVIPTDGFNSLVTTTLGREAYAYGGYTSPTEGKEVITTATYYFNKNNTVKIEWNAASSAYDSTAGVSWWGYAPAKNDNGQGISFDWKYWCVELACFNEDLRFNAELTWYRD